MITSSIDTRYIDLRLPHHTWPRIRHGHPPRAYDIAFFVFGPFPPPVDTRVVAQSPDRQCVICLTYEKTHAFMPCGHLCVCEECGMRAFEERHACPVCRAVATQCRVIYS